MKSDMSKCVSAMLSTTLLLIATTASAACYRTGEHGAAYAAIGRLISQLTYDVSMALRDSMGGGKVCFDEDEPNTRFEFFKKSGTRVMRTAAFSRVEGLRCLDCWIFERGSTSIRIEIDPGAAVKSYEIGIYDKSPRIRERFPENKGLYYNANLYP